MRRGPTIPVEGLAWVLLLAAPLYLWGLGAVGFQDPDEGMYAEIAREMLASGDWVVPTFNGVPYIEKPPLMYWMTAGTLAVLGPSEFAARLWKVVPILGAVALTGALGARLFSPQVGVFAAGILATTLGAYLFSRITVMDPLLLLGVTLAAYGLACGGERFRRRADLWFWGGVTVGVLGKGIPGLVFPAGLLACWSLTQRDPGVFRRVCTARGVLGAFLLVLPWHVLAAGRVPGFAAFYLVDNQLLRYLGARAYAEDGSSLGSLTFLGVTWCAMLPWAPFFFAALTLPIRGGPTAAHRWFCVGWIGLVVGVFVTSSFKLEYYALPAFPAMALLVAVLVVRAADPSGGRQFAVLRRWAWISLAGGVMYCVVVGGLWLAGLVTPRAIVHGLSFWSTNYRVVLEHGLPLPPVVPERYVAVLLSGGALWTTGCGVAVWLLGRKRAVAAAVCIGAVGVGLIALAGVVLREVEPHHSLKPLAERLNGLLRADDILVHERGLEKGGGLLFYTQRQVLILNGRRGDLQFGAGLAGSDRRFIAVPKFRRLWNGSARVFLVTDLPSARSAISDAALVSSTLVASTGTRWLYANRPIERP